MNVRSAVLALALFAVLPGAGTAETPAASDERYRVLAERNIFLKDRSPRGGGRFPVLRPSAPEPPVPPERSVVLTGVVRHGTEYVAFFEDRRSGAVIRVRAGDALHSGRVERVALDYIEYAKDGRTGKIEIGRNLENASPVAGGVPAFSILRPRSESPAPAVQSAAPAPAVPVDEKAVLEMLRRRRLSESGGT